MPAPNAEMIEAMQCFASVPRRKYCNVQRVGKRLAARHGSQVMVIPWPRAITQRMSAFRLALPERP